VILIAIVLIIALNAIPGLSPPAPTIIQVLILLVAIIVIANRAGMF